MGHREQSQQGNSSARVLWKALIHPGQASREDLPWASGLGYLAAIDDLLWLDCLPGPVLI